MALINPPPISEPAVDPKTGKGTMVWNNFYTRIQKILSDLSSNFAPASSQYIVQQPTSELANEQALSLLDSGFVKVATATGVLSSQAEISSTDLEATSVTAGSYTVNSHPIFTVNDQGQLTDASNVTVTKSDLSLGNVENTALSTWAGSTNLTTLGTVATGTWNGTAIPYNYGGTTLTSYTQGDILYASSSSALAKLAKDTNSTRYLSNQGTSNNPSWNQINLANGVTGNLPVGNLNSGTSASSSTFWRGDGAWSSTWKDSNGTDGFSFINNPSGTGGNGIQLFPGNTTNNQNPEFQCVGSGTNFGISFRGKGDWFHAIHSTADAPSRLALYAQNSETNKVTVQAPTSISSSYTFALPSAVAASNDSFLVGATSGATSFKTANTLFTATSWSPTANSFTFSGGGSASWSASYCRIGSIVMLTATLTNSLGGASTSTCTNGVSNITNLPVANTGTWGVPTFDQGAGTFIANGILNGSGTIYPPAWTAKVAVCFTFYYLV